MAGAEPKGAIDLSDAELKDAREILRVFLPGKEPVAGGVFVDPPASLQPFGYGMLLADLVHHGAQAYAFKFDLDVEAVRRSIAEGLMAELATPTDDARQVLPKAH